jgi:hypothetical protein
MAFLNEIMTRHSGNDQQNNSQRNQPTHDRLQVKRYLTKESILAMKRPMDLLDLETPKAWSRFIVFWAKTVMAILTWPA